MTLSTIKGGAKSRAESIRKKSLLKCPNCGLMNTTKWCSHKCSKAWHDMQAAIRNKAEGERRRRAQATLKEAMVEWQGYIVGKESGVSYAQRIGVPKRSGKPTARKRHRTSAGRPSVGLTRGLEDMGTTTGQNTGLSAALLMEQYRRTGHTEAARRTWVDAGYCLDAPELIAAGSHERDIFGDGPEDWLPMQTTVARMSSNAM